MNVLSDVPRWSKILAFSAYRASPSAASIRTGRSMAASPRSPNSHHPSPAIGIAARIRSSEIGRHSPPSPGAMASPARLTYSSHSNAGAQS